MAVFYLSDDSVQIKLFTCKEKITIGYYRDAIDSQYILIH